jgi:hypothetical protein
VQVTKKLLVACALSATFMIVEVVGGYIAGRYVRVPIGRVHVLDERGQLLEKFDAHAILKLGGKNVVIEMATKSVRHSCSKACPNLSDILHVHVIFTCLER